MRDELKDSLDYVKKNTAFVIEKIEGDNLQKENIYNKLKAAKNKETFLKILSESKLSELRKI